MSGDAANAVLAVCGVLGLVLAAIGGAYGYGAFRGRSNAMMENSRKATERMFARLTAAEERCAETADRIATLEELDQLRVYQLREMCLVNNLTLPDQHPQSSPRSKLPKT